MTITVETGPMFSDKSSAIIKHLDRHEIHQHQLGADYLAFNHSSDIRYGMSVIANHKGESYPCFTLTTSTDLLEFIFDLDPDSDQPFTIKPQFLHIQGLYLDEGQFFDMGLVEVIALINHEYLFHPDRKEPLLIDVAGLDLDFRGEPFGPIPGLMAKATEVHKHKAECIVCGKSNATRTQRIVNGQPALYTDPVILIGAKETYTARCEKDHQVPGKPTPTHKQK